MAGRTIAIGDVHGCLDALRSLFEFIAPEPQDTIVTLGDYIDRGTNSREVLDYLIALSDRCRVIPILGDHEEMLLNALRDIAALKRWFTCGGVEMLRSYGWTPGGSRSSLADWIPIRHQEFLADCSLSTRRTHICSCTPAICRMC